MNDSDSIFPGIDDDAEIPDPEPNQGFARHFVAFPLGVPPDHREVRRRLQEKVEKDLLGPAEGPEEEVDEQSVRDRYIVGALAPQRRLKAEELIDEATLQDDDLGAQGAAGRAAMTRTRIPVQPRESSR